MKTWLNSVSDVYHLIRMEEKYKKMAQCEKEDMEDNDQSNERNWLKKIFKALLTFTLLLVFQLFLSAQINEPLEIKAAYIESFNEGNTLKLSHYFGDKLSKNKSRNLSKSFKRALRLVGRVESMTLEGKTEDTYRYKAVHEKMSTLEVIFELGSEGQLLAMTLGPYVYKNAPQLERNKTSLILPFKGEWYTFWGGKTTSQNYHNSSPQMRGAYDFWVMGENGKSHGNGATRNEDFYAFGKDIIAPADGKVVFTSDGVKDNNWPSMNPDAAYGNVVMLETENKEYMVFAHLKLNSVSVKKGQEVKQGDLLGQCGNSGNSTEPHLHFQMQNIADFSSPTGAFTYFKEILVNGRTKKDYMPVRRDKVSNKPKG